MFRTFVVLLLGVSAFGATTNPEVRLTPPRRGAVIVEFRATRTAAATFEQFRRDVATLDRRAARSALDPIRYEYRHAILGAAVDAPVETVDALRRLPYVRAVHPDRTVEMYAAPGAVPHATVDAAARINASSLGTRGEGIRVGVLDTGIDYRHPALGGAFGAGNKVAGGYDFVNRDDDPLDDHGHGTHVSGIIAADSAELGGVAPAVTLIAYKVLNFAGQGSQSDVIAAIERSIDPNQDGSPADHLDVINLSLGGPGTADDLVSQAVDNATAAGVTVVVAAGNSGSLASIGSPGTARTAITVGAHGFNDVVTTFSSRGPSPSTLLFKPDVLAPGFAIYSTYAGGGYATLNGTSMAAPHVAGAAALLKKLHPEWTPADIKSALVTTTLATTGSPVERAAGRIDTAHAAIATSFVDNTGLSFGLDAGKTGSFEAIRTVTVTNRSGVDRSFDIVATNVPAGALLTATPSSLQLAAGASKSVELRLAADNTAVAFPESAVHGGDVEFRGAGSFALPWILMRAARIRVHYDNFAESILALSPDDAQQLYRYEPGKADLFARPDSVWDLMVAGYDFGETGGVSALRFVTAENRMAAGDEELTLHRDDATANMRLDGRNEQGTPFNELPVDAGSRSGHVLSLRFRYAKSPELVASYHFLSVPNLVFTPVSTTFTFHPFETYFDFRGQRAYNVQHAPLSGITESKTLTAGGDALKRVRLHFPTRGDFHGMISCTASGVTTPSKVVMGGGICFGIRFDDEVVLDYFTTMESGGGVSGIDFDAGTTGVAPLRGIDGAIVSVPYTTPSPAAYRISDGEDITLGTSALFPYAFHGTMGQWYYGLTSGFRGPLNESYRYATAGTSWTLFDGANAQKSSGVLEVDQSPNLPEPQPGDRFLAVRGEMNVAGRPSRGELEVRFGSDPADVIAPTLTSLRVVNALGRIIGRLEPGSAVALHFSAADFEYPSGATRPLNAAATRVWYRLSGTSAWVPINAVTHGSDLGSLTTLGHPPTGDQIRADLSPSTGTAGSVDIRIQVEDTAGNRTTWTQAPAFIVGSPTTPTKRRSVR